jgi:hypothetical protein
MTNHVDKAARQLEIGRAVMAERHRCITIAESFAAQGGGADGEGEIYIARRIAEVIRTGPIFGANKPLATK